MRIELNYKLLPRDIIATKIEFPYVRVYLSSISNVAILVLIISDNNILDQAGKVVGSYV